VRHLVSVLVTGAYLLIAPAVAAAGASDATTCGFIHASVPYSAGGHAKQWRVYVTGTASCSTATNVLNAVMHLKGQAHGRTGAYVTYAGWLCPNGQMGEQTCVLPAGSSTRGPYRASALARSCSGFQQSCPAKLPASDI